MICTLSDGYGTRSLIRPINFDTPEVVKEVDKFQYVKWVQMTGGLSFGPARQDNEHREIYTNVCRALIYDLFMIAISGGVELDFSAASNPPCTLLHPPYLADNGDVDAS
jgi:hypothetical protein